MMSSSFETTKLPDHLLSELSKGNVVAFVGAGFSAGANFPTWGALIEGIAADQPEIPGREREIITTLSASKNFQDLDMAAQLLSDAITPLAFNEAIRTRLTITDKDALSQEMKDRLEYLTGIPFAAIITTNYDNLLSGIDAQDSVAFQRATYGIMRAKIDEYSRLESIAFSKHRRSSMTPIIKLHGDVERPGSTFVCTREGYRHLLHGSSSQYSTFLKTLLATHTMLYIGFSFSDAYINELRQEIMALYGSHGSSSGAPLGYAIMCGVSDVQQTALLRHDGLKIINYEWEELTGHKEFNNILNSLYLTSNPTIKFGKVLHERNVMWVHTNWQASKDSRYLKEYLEEANRLSMGSLTCNMTVVSSAKEAISVLSSGGGVDCIVCVYDSSAEYKDYTTETEILIGTETTKLLLQLRGEIGAPVVVFGMPTESEQRRSKVMRLGARCYTHRYYDLLTEMASVLKSVLPIALTEIEK